MGLGDPDLLDDGGGGMVGAASSGGASANVFCSICLESVMNDGDRSTARLQCGHQFHLDCIGSAFNVKGVMQCPNCRQIEKGNWLYSNGYRSMPEFSLDDWMHDDDIYDVAYSEVPPFGVHFCPFNRLARFPFSYEDNASDYLSVPTRFGDNDLFGHPALFNDYPGISLYRHLFPYTGHVHQAPPSSGSQKGPMVDFPGFQTYAVQQPSSADLLAVGMRDTEDRLQKSEMRFHRQVQGPESIAFDSLGRGPYTGVADGRVLFWDGNAWQDFAVTSPNRSEVCQPKLNPISYLKYEHICGRPLGIRFHKRTGELYIADAYYGILKVGPEGGLATQVTTEAEGVPFNFTNDLDVDEQGNIFFTDSSSVYQRRNFMQLVFTAEPSGRLLKYSPVTKETTVLSRHLQFPNGVSLSKDGSFLVYCESSIGRLTRYWLKGGKAGRSESFAVLPGFPDNVRTNKEGEFWVALHCRRSFLNKILSIFPRLRKLVLSLPIPAKYHYYVHAGGKPHAVVIKYDVAGNMLQILEDSRGRVVRQVSEVVERDGQLWIGSVLMPFIAVYPLNP